MTDLKYIIKIWNNDAGTARAIVFSGLAHSDVNHHTTGMAVSAGYCHIKTGQLGIVISTGSNSSTLNLESIDDFDGEVIRQTLECERDPDILRQLWSEHLKKQEGFKRE